MAYSYQTFTSGQVLTGAQAQQIETNIRDHQHGFSSVQNIGLTWPVGSINAARAITVADGGFMLECTGDFQLDLLPASQLGSLFAVSLVNTGSGRIVLAAASGESVGVSSQFVLTPKGSITIYGDGSSPFNLFGHTVGDFVLADVVVGSQQTIDLTAIFPGDFPQYELRLLDPVFGTGGGGVFLQVSVDSGSTYLTPQYRNTVTNTSYGILLSRALAISSNELKMSSVVFSNPANSLNDFYSTGHLTERGGAGLAVDPPRDNLAGGPTSLGIVNALRISNSFTGSNFISGRVVLLGRRYAA